MGMDCWLLAKRPETTSTWIPGYWSKKDEGYAWVEGHWITQTTETVIVKEAPPAIRTEAAPKSPGTDYVWVAGHWYRINDTWDWSPGYYEVAPQPKMTWVAGHWEKKGEGWFWMDGQWKAQ